MDDKRVEPSGPPPVGKGTPIVVKGAGHADAAKPKETAPVSEPEATVEEAVPANSPVPVTAADKDLQAIDMGDDIDNQADNNKQSPQFAPPKKSKGGKKKFLVIALVLLVGVVLVAAAMWFMKRHKSTPAAPQTTSNQSSSNSDTASTQPEAPTSKTYKNDTLKIELTYPSTWKPTEKANQVVFASPEISYTKKDGTTTKGSFRLIVQKGYSQTDSTTINNSVAVKTSELVKYTAPATGQRTESYLSYLGTDKNTFVFMMITSGKQYNVGDTVAATYPMTQESYIIVGGYGTGKGENIDFDSISPDKIQQNDAYTQAVDMIKSLKISS